MKKVVSDSECFGIAWDANVPECSNCDAFAQCEKLTKAQTRAVKPESPNPYTPSKVEKVKLETKPPVKKETAPKKDKPTTTVKKDKPAAVVNPAWPDFKSLSIEELENLAVEKGLDLEKFANYEQRIKRMQITMNLKKCNW